MHLTEVYERLHTAQSDHHARGAQKTLALKF